MTRKSTPPKKGSRTWSLVVGSIIICLSLWALHRFCDDHAESVLNRRAALGAEMLVVEPEV